MLVMICFTGASQAAMIATPTDRSQLLGVLERVEVQSQLAGARRERQSKPKRVSPR